MDPSLVTPDQIKEKNKRDAEAEPFERQKKKFADWWGERYRVDRRQYNRLGGNDPNQDAKLQHAGLAILNDDLNLLTPGFYERETPDGKHHYHMWIQTKEEGGGIVPLFGNESNSSFFGGPGPLGGVITDTQFKKGYGEVMDIMASGLGCTSVCVDWPNSRDVSEKYLMKLMNLAAKRGLTVEFGPNVNLYLANLKSNSKRKRILAVYEALQNFQQVDKLVGNITPKQENLNFDRHKNALNDPANNKLPAAERQDGEAEDAAKIRRNNAFKDSVYGNNPSLDDKINRIDEQIKKLEARMKKVDRGNTELNTYLEGHEKVLKDPNAFIIKNPIKKHKTRAKIVGAIAAAGAAALGAVGVGLSAATVPISAAATLGAYKKAHDAALYNDSTDRRSAKVYESRNELTRDPKKLVEYSGTIIAKTEKSRDALAQSLDSEGKDLKEQRKLWKKELAELKQQLERGDGAAPLTEEEKEKKKGKIKGLEDALTKLGGDIDRSVGEVAATKVRNTNLKELKTYALQVTTEAERTNKKKP